MKSLFLQDLVAAKRMTVEQVHGKVNPADLMTKCIDTKTLVALLPSMNLKKELYQANQTMNRVKVTDTFKFKVRQERRQFS